jgi:hypothetical protein
MLFWPGCCCTPRFTVACCPNSIPETLHLSDGIDSDIPLVYGSYRTTGANVTGWGGCVYRSTTLGHATALTSGAGGCTGGLITVSLAFQYVLTCINSPSGSWRLSMYFRSCGISEVDGVHHYFIAGIPCDQDQTGTRGIFSGAGGPVGETCGNSVATDCDPYSITFTKTYPGTLSGNPQGYLLGQYFGTSASWTISE